MSESKPFPSHDETALNHLGVARQTGEYPKLVRHQNGSTREARDSHEEATFRANGYYAHQMHSIREAKPESVENEPDESRNQELVA
jgi:hypothetical protein